MNGDPVVALEGVDIVFGRDPATALRLLDAGRSRDEIRAATGMTVGAAGVSLTVGRGEIYVLMGLSGSGKSTVLRAVNRLVPVTRGAVRIADGDRMVDVATAREADLRRLRQRRVTMVFQQFALLPWRTVAENVGFGLELAGRGVAERKARVAEVLALVGLADWAGRQAHELSGGMQQRVGLARALATDADVLLMDEPFSALDPLIRTRLQDELLALQKVLGKTIVFVSHDLDEALKLGSRIAIMEAGRIVQQGRPEEIVLRPANAYVRDFVANVNPLSVLTAYNVMRDFRDLAPAGDGWLWLDRRQTTRIRLDDARRAVGCEVAGQPARWVDVADAGGGLPGPAGGSVVRCREAVPLRLVMAAMQHDADPVAVFDADDRLTGAIGVQDALKAVLRRESA